MSGFRNYLHLALHVLGLLAMLGAAALVVVHHNARLDLTPQKLWTLSPHSKKILDGVEQPAEVLAFMRREDARNDYLEDLLWRVNRYEPRVTYRIIDVNRSPALARRYKVSAYGAIVVESAGRRKTFTGVSEELLMGALVGVTRNYEKTVYFLTGHGERDAYDSDRYRGYTTARRSLEDELYHVKTLVLASEGEVPGDATVVIAAAPREDLLPQETLALRRFVDGGGSLLAMVDPDTASSFVAFLESYGLRLPPEIVADGDYKLAASEALTMRVPGRGDSLITDGLDADPVFSMSRPIEVADGEGLASVLLETSADSWAIPARGGEIPDDHEYHPGRDRRGPFALGRQIRIDLGQDEPSEDGPPIERLERRSSRLVVLGDADFANNFFVELLGNRDLFVNAVNWLALEESLIGVRPVRKERGKEQFFVSERQRYNAFWLGTVIQPSIFLAVGLVIFVWRRLR